MKHIESILIVDGNRGIYAPQQFVKHLDIGYLLKSNVRQLDIDILKIGPDHPDYWDAWDDITLLFEDPDGNVILENDGDIFLIHKDSDFFEEE